MIHGSNFRLNFSSLTLRFPEVDNGVVILEHVHLINVLQLLHAFGENMVSVSIIQISHFQKSVLLRI